MEHINNFSYMFSYGTLVNNYFYGIGIQRYPLMAETMHREMSICSVWNEQTLPARI